MSTISKILTDNQDMTVALFVEGQMFLDGRVVEVNEDTVTLEMNVNAQRQAFSGGEDLKKQTLIHAAVLLDKIVRVDRIATKG